MKRTATLSFVLAFLVVILLGSSGFAQGGNEGNHKKTTIPGCPTDISSCPDEGCSEPEHEFDFGLNVSKNRATPPNEADVIDLSLADILAMDQPAWSMNKDRSSITGAMKEGQPVRVMGYLWKAKREGSESCNCGLDDKGIKGQLLTDIHMVMTVTPNAKEKTSVTAEITPRVRATRLNPETWDWSSIQTFDKKFIRVTGYLMLDTAHLIEHPLVRKTNWEVHPVTKLEVCISTVTKCRNGQGWANVK